MATSRKVCTCGRSLATDEETISNACADCQTSVCPHHSAFAWPDDRIVCVSCWLKSDKARKAAVA